MSEKENKAVELDEQELEKVNGGVIFVGVTGPTGGVEAMGSPCDSKQFYKNHDCPSPLNTASCENCPGRPNN